MNRRKFLQTAGAAPLLWTSETLPAAGAPSKNPAPIREHSTIPPALRTRLDSEIQTYMQRNAAPGLQFALTDLHGQEYLASFGYENIEEQKPLRPNRLFQIGSISKSMATIAALQLVEEGKVDLHRPVLEYLPWLPWKTSFGPVTLDHILTHSSGMPNGGSLFFPRNFWTHEQRYAPGKQYFYSNMAFNAVGRLVEMCDSRPYQESLVARIFRPVGMTASRSALGGPEWALQSISYIPAAVDTPYRRFDPLRQAPSFHEDTSAGCVASTPADMAKYLRCLLHGGVTDSGTRILSKESFETMTSHHIDTEEWGPHAGYGYGIGVDTTDGDHIAMHTGGMVGFMSAIYLNLSRGVAAFASINAQLGYRPMPVARFATQALVAQAAGTASPAPIPAPAVEKPRPPVSPSTPEFRTSKYGGLYVNDDPWRGAIRVTEIDSVLHLEGRPLVPGPDGSFYLASSPNAPDRVAFDGIIQGVAHLLLLNGAEYVRFNAPSST